MQRTKRAVSTDAHPESLSCRPRRDEGLFGVCVDPLVHAEVAHTAPPLVIPTTTAASGIPSASFIPMGGAIETTNKWAPAGESLSGAELAYRETVACQPQEASDTCSVCMDEFPPGSQDCVRLTKCPTYHCFHFDCIASALQSCPRCPNCLVFVSPPCGTQPAGKMSILHHPTPIPGEEGPGMFVLSYYFPHGIQGPEHPEPGRPYTGTSRRAFLPDSPAGCRILQKFMRAWDARLLFTVGSSITTGATNTVVWNGIHHKTNVTGGSSQFGFPDATYLKRVEHELATAGIY